jgi:transmembrane 9 superfamily member 2/4
MAPTSYRHADPVPLTVNVLKPFQLNDDPLQSVIAYDYYMNEFHFCAPSEGPESVSESLGSILFGDRIFTSPIQLHMRLDEVCKNVCPDGKPVSFTPRDAEFVNLRIRQKYVVDYLADGLPAGMRGRDEATNEDVAIPGFELGQVDTPDPNGVYLNNHYDLTIEYHQAGDNEYRVVGFTVDPASRKDNTGKDGVCGTQGNRLQLSETQITQVYWTYSVRWVESDTSFATRWDKYLHVVDPRIHWFWLVNAAVVVVLLVAMVSTILMRALRKDIARYNRLDEIAMEDYGGTGMMDDGVQEDSGWKLVHGDVFRPPRYPLPLSILIGNGAQLFMMTGFTIGSCFL